VLVARKAVLFLSPVPGGLPFGDRATWLQPVANRPIVSHVAEALRAAAVQEIVVVGSPGLCARLRARDGDAVGGGVAVRYVAHGADEPTCDALREAAGIVGDASCFVHVADGLLAEPLAGLAQRADDSSSDLLAVVHRDARGPERLGATARRLLRIADFDPTRTALGIAGVCVFGPGALARVAETGWIDGGRLDPVELADRLVAAGGRLDVHVARGWCRYGGDALDLLELNRSLLDALTPENQLPQAGDSSIEGRVMIDPSARVTASVIVGPVIIGGGASISDSYVGPYTSIGAGSHIEGAEIERSIICAGVTISHLGGRLVSSVVGSNAHIFRDFSVPRAMRLQVGDNVEVAFS
jgi:glucose-1-phosphate thymidylyltransferase